MLMDYFASLCVIYPPSWLLPPSPCCPYPLPSPPCTPSLLLPLHLPPLPYLVSSLIPQHSYSTPPPTLQLTPPPLQGFLPEDWDDFVTHSLYPSYTYTVLLFLGMSSLYGLWKTGKISVPFLGPQQQPPKDV